MTREDRGQRLNKHGIAAGSNVIFAWKSSEHDVQLPPLLRKAIEEDRRRVALSFLESRRKRCRELREPQAE
jgi:hypothetical protein